MEINHIKKAKERFDKELHSSAYHKIHSDLEHLNNLLQLLDIQAGECCLDLGTGNGYLAFEMAEQNPSCSITGLDIAENSIKQNNLNVKKANLSNLDFLLYNGIDFPFPDHSFNKAISRYALHHFPNMEHAVREISRILQPDGKFLFCDPKTYNADKNGFIDLYQQLQKDGHNHFFKEKELIYLFEKNCFTPARSFVSSVRYPRLFTKEYETLLSTTSEEIKNLYQIELVGEQIFITVEVMNILFKKNSPN